MSMHDEYSDFVLARSRDLDVCPTTADALLEAIWSRDVAGKPSIAKLIEAGLFGAKDVEAVRATCRRVLPSVCFGFTREWRERRTRRAAA